MASPARHSLLLPLRLVALAALLTSALAQSSLLGAGQQQRVAYISRILSSSSHHSPSSSLPSSLPTSTLSSSSSVARSLVQAKRTSTVASSVARSGTVAVSNKTAPTKALPAGGCGGPTKCPDESECVELTGAPTCECDSGNYSRLLDGVCTAAPLKHWGWLDIQNSARAALGIDELTWNGDLANQAQTWANTLAAQGCLVKVGKPPGVGQNVANRIADIQFRNFDAVGLWVGQGGRYKLSPFDQKGAAGCGSGKWSDCAAYTQVVWNATKDIGCAMARCSSPVGKVYVCNYSPSGNAVGQLPYSA